MRIDDIRRVMVLGAGRMGTEVALQCAIGGFDVILHDVSEEQLGKAAGWQQIHFDEFLREDRLTPDDIAAVRRRITSTTDPQLAADVDLINESVPENLKLKRDLFAKFHTLCPPHTVFTSNTSYLRPSQIAGHVGRPERFAALHFHPPVWKSNVVDIMPHDGTDPAIVELLKQFSGRIGQIPIVCRHQGEGYVFNMMLRTWLLTAITLADSGITSFEDIDRSWMGVMLSKVGPFGILDNIGLDTVCDILHFWGMILRDPQAKKASEFLKPYVEAKRLGIKTMCGFYNYPDATYLRDDFLTGNVESNTAADALIRRFVESGPNGVRARKGNAARRTSTGAESASRATSQASSSTQPSAPDAAATAATPGSPMTSSDDAPHRYLLRALPTVVHQKLKHPVQFAGPCLIVGENPSAQALRERLESMGGTVVSLPLKGALPEILQSLDQLWSANAYPHLFLMTGRDADAATQWEHDWWQRRYERGVLLPFYACQKWYAEVLRRGLFETATVVGATALGGDFGVGGRIEAVEGGGIAGLLKTVYLEGAVRSSLGPQVKVVDAPLSQPPETTAEQLCRELALAQASVVTGSRDESRRRYTELEVGFVKGIRHQIYLEPIEATPSEPEADWAVPPGSTWVVSGGARGITAFVARELGRRFHLRLHLLGTTPLPAQALANLTDDEFQQLEEPTRQEAEGAGRDADRAWSRLKKGRELQQSLHEFAAAGVRATYHACDVTNRDQLAATLDAVRAADGPIAGVLHGAGLEIGSKLPDKKPADVEATLAVKGTGMAALMELTRNDPLQWFVAFGSLSGRFGNFAQADYAMANELLAKQLVWLRTARPDCRCTVIHWPGWSDVGMAAREQGKEGLRRGHHNFLEPDQGMAHLLNELTQETPASEVVIVHRNEVPLEMRITTTSGGKRAPTWQK